jgi:hypothetical protein
MDINCRGVGLAPLITALGRERGIVESINETVEWDEKKCFIDSGIYALAMVIRILRADPTIRLVYCYCQDEKGLNYTYGYNKERRRNLK